MRLWRTLKKYYSSYRQKTTQRRSYILLEMALAMASDGRNIEALNVCDMVLVQDSENAVAWIIKAHVLFKLGKMEETRVAFNNYMLYAGAGQVQHLHEVKKMIEEIETHLPYQEASARS